MHFSKRSVGLFFILYGLLFFPAIGDSGIEIFDFRLSHLSQFQSSGTSFSGSFAWSPWIGVGETMGVRGILGISPAKGKNSSVIFIVDTAALLTLPLGPGLGLELGPGIQYWIDAGGSTFSGSGGIVIDTPDLLGIFDALFADYTAVFLTNNLTHQIRIGLQM